jgi:hypothetical protein
MKCHYSTITHFGLRLSITQIMNVLNSCICDYISRKLEKKMLEQEKILKKNKKRFKYKVSYILVFNLNIFIS